jgi:flagellar hook-associated protein 2
MGTSPVGFTGGSLFANDLQQVITRAVNIASLPIQQLTNEKNKLSSQASALSQLSDQFTKLQASITSLTSAATSGSIAANVSDSSVVTATASASTLPGTYNVQVLDPGTFSSSISNNGLTTVTNPAVQNISASTSFTLSVGATNYPLTLSGSTLNALADSINGSGAPVQATIINIGTGAQPDYRLAIQATGIGAQAIQLNDGSQDLLNSLAPGSNASYTVNGQPAGGISSTSRTVTIAPGLTANLEKAGTATISVAHDTTSVRNSLSAFVNAYNAVADELDKSHGVAGGALSGDSVVFSTSATLRSITSYSNGASTFSTLESLGIGFDKSGRLEFDPSQISSLSQTQTTALNNFLGDGTSTGFLKSSADALKSLLDPTNGLLPQAVSSVDAQISNQQQLIDTNQARVDALKTSLLQRIGAADALIASLEQQNNFITGLFNYNNGNSQFK